MAQIIIMTNLFLCGIEPSTDSWSKRITFPQFSFGHYYLGKKQTVDLGQMVSDVSNVNNHSVLYWNILNDENMSPSINLYKLAGLYVGLYIKSDYSNSHDMIRFLHDTMLA